MPINKKATETYGTVCAELCAAAQGEDSATFENALMKFAQNIENRVLAEANALQAEHDVAVLAARGVRQLTSEENHYYNAVIGAMHSVNPQQALENLDVTMPETIINDVFEDLETSHPLLAAIDFKYSKGVIKWLLNTSDGPMAVWGRLTDAIITELTGGFKELDISQNKLSAFLPISKAMLDLGPMWLDRYVRTFLIEASALGLENGIINGRGTNTNVHEPVGMVRDLSAPVDQNEGYAAKSPVKIKHLDPATFGQLLGDIAIDEHGKPRKVGKLIFVVNSVDYFRRVFPATTFLLPDGKYVNNILPYPCEIIQSQCVEKDRAVLGIGKKYFMASGTGKDGMIDFSDHHRFLQDERVYLTKLYGHGQPKDNNAFVYLDISELDASPLKVQVVSTAASAEQDTPEQDTPTA